MAQYSISINPKAGDPTMVTIVTNKRTFGQNFIETERYDAPLAVEDQDHPVMNLIKLAKMAPAFPLVVVNP